MSKYKPSDKHTDWPPDTYTPTEGYLRQTITQGSTSTHPAASSSKFYHPTDITQLEPPSDTWLRKHKKTFHNTPSLPHTMPVGEVDPPRGSASPDGEPTLIVKQGAKCQTPSDGPNVGIDWLRFSGPREQRHKAICLLEKYFGESKPGKGRFFLNSGYHFSSGGVFYDDDQSPKSKAVIELPSSLLAELHQPDLVRRISSQLHYMGFKCIRSDIAVDFFDQPELLETALRSCEEGFLTGSKTFRLTYGKSSGKSTGRTLNIGKRGKEGSGRFLRIYDKGLETKTHEPNQWIRWEAELSDDCSAKFMTDFIAQDDTRECQISHAMGVCDFREEPHKRLSRRPRCQWFADLLGSITPITTKQTRQPPNIYTKVRWFQTCVAPALRTIQHVTGHTLDNVLQTITGAVPPKHSKLQETFIREICSSLGVPITRIHEQFLEAT